MSDSSPCRAAKLPARTVIRIATVLLALAGGGAVVLTQAPAEMASAAEGPMNRPPNAAAPQPSTTSAGDTAQKALPKLVDLGAGKCIPCKKMAPILEELKKEYAGSLDVVFIDVWKTPEQGEKYKINLIPTQIFFDASGKELSRHEGFFGKEDILAEWKRLGVNLPAPTPPPK